VRLGGKLYNCAAVISGGEVDGLVAKTHIPGAEKRWFASGRELDGEAIGYEELGLTGSGELIPIGTGELFRVGDAVVGVEICQDLLAPIPVSSELAVNGAEVIVNLSASPELAGKTAYRRNLVRHQSLACNCVYAYVSAGRTESTTDQVFCGQSLIGENGRILAERSGRPETDYMLVTDCDLGRVRADRLRNPCYSYAFGGSVQASCRSDGSLYPLRKLPFIPSDKADREARCNEIFDIQVAGLKQRLQTIGANAVIGISGGLDSTLALLVAAEAMRQLGRPMTDVYGVTMPCFGTSDRTYHNSLALMDALGITQKEINIRDAVTTHFRDIGHNSAVHNGTYENSQARERTQILMDYASVVNGIVVGTGDLSELALGWCTYNGDHMSMYGVNGSVPKTLIGPMIGVIAEQPEFQDAKQVLLDIVDTPISPELLQSHRS
jgi:NAD+ synthase (glutamine-hydrolysing)